MIVAVFGALCGALLIAYIAVGVVRICRRDRQQEVILASQPACSHPGAIPVDTLYGERERVAWLCPDCDRQLPADHGQMALARA